MSRAFRDDKVCSGSTRKPTKEEIKASIANVKVRLKLKNKEMDILANMYNSYDYNQNHINEIIGACYVAISHIKVELKRLKKEI